VYVQMGEGFDRMDELLEQLPPQGPALQWDGAGAPGQFPGQGRGGHGQGRGGQGGAPIFYMRHVRSRPCHLPITHCMYIQAAFPSGVCMWTICLSLFSGFLVLSLCNPRFRGFCGTSLGALLSYVFRQWLENIRQWESLCVHVSASLALSCRPAELCVCVCVCACACACARVRVRVCVCMRRKSLSTYTSRLCFPSACVK
jgi:hypothetical protein